MSDRPVVGVVGPATEDAVADAGSTIADTTAAVEAAGATPRVGGQATVPDCEYLVAIGESALQDLARERPNAPILPVEAGRGVRSVPAAYVRDGVTALLTDEWQPDTHPLLAVGVGARTAGTVLFDAMVVTAEPAEISEFAVRAGGEAVAQFRADGVAVATPAGSPGYTRAAGGPVVPPETDAAVIVPIAPFGTDVGHWVVPMHSVGISVERDESAVELLTDGEAGSRVTVGQPVTITPDGSVTVAVVAVSQSCFGPGDRTAAAEPTDGLEKL